jgi:hypothetical protein
MPLYAPIPEISTIPSLSPAIQTLCTRGVQGMLTGGTWENPLSIPCTPGVLPLYTARIPGGLMLSYLPACALLRAFAAT